MKKLVTGSWLVQVGYGKGSYRTKYSFRSDQPSRAMLHYASLNTHSGHKKRLVNPNGQVVARVLT